MRVQIVDTTHPHYPEHGALTGKVISVAGTPMAEMRLDHCCHGTDACFVARGQVANELTLTPRRRKRAKQEGQ